MNRRKFLLTAGSGIIGLAGLSMVSTPLINHFKKNMKQILVITGSPRRKGNSDLLADAFIKGAQSVGNEVVKFETALKDLNNCQACDNCFKNNNLACIFKDDFNELAKEILKADVIVFSTPLYWSSYPSNMKNAIDKLYSFFIGNKLDLLKNKKIILLAVGETKDEKGFDILLQTHKEILDYHKWIDAGQLIVPAVVAKGDILRTGALSKAEIMGKNI